MKKTTLFIALFSIVTVNAQIIFSDDFNTETPNATTLDQWISNDIDGDGAYWEIMDMLAFSTSPGGVPNHPIQTNAVDSDSWEGNSLTPDNYLTTKNPLDLTHATGTSLTYTVGSYQINGIDIADKYSIYLTTSNNPADIALETPVITKLVSDDAPCNQADGSASAATVTIDISAYEGQLVYLTFRHYDSEDENSVLIDDVLVDGILAVADPSFNNFDYYVANNELNLTANTTMSQVSLYNVLGQQVVSQKLNNTNEVVSISSLNPGVYIANVSIEGASKTFKIVKK